MYRRDRVQVKKNPWNFCRILRKTRIYTCKFSDISQKTTEIPRKSRCTRLWLYEGQSGMTFVLVSTCPLKPNVFCHSVKPAQCIQNERNYFQLDIIAFASSSIYYARAEKLYFWPFCVNIALRCRWRHFRRKYWLCKQTEQIILKYRSRVFVPYRFQSSWS